MPNRDVGSTRTCDSAPSAREMENADNVELLKLQRSSSLHWFHWAIVSLSLCITFAVWHYSRNQVQERRQRQFTREAGRVVNLVQERMQKYEDALWGAVAMIDTVGSPITLRQWTQYSESLRIDQKYPEVNGIGLIDALTPEAVPAYLEQQRRDRSSFNIHPQHDGIEYYPITFIEPAADNAWSVGLDMAHESHRYSAAIKARDTGLAQITGPIVLVQGDDHRPGFLFYAPFYSGDGHPQPEQRRETFSGMVYAPFVVEKLMKGTLSRERHVGVRITDGSDVLYDEHVPGVQDYDGDPLFSRSTVVPLYGREWTFDIRSAHSFREAQGNSQPITILIGGLTIDMLLVGLFVTISRANRKALAYADSVTKELREKAHDLEESNQELERFAYVASHDLQEPLRMVGSFAALLDEEYRGHFDERGERWLGFMIDGANRMQALVQGLLEYSRVGRDEGATSRIDTNRLVDSILTDLERAIDDAGASVTRDDLPAVFGHEHQIRALFQNLIANAVKFHHPDTRPTVHVGAQVDESATTFFVRDNGIGIEPEYAERVFVIFQRLHSTEVYAGTGLGLAISRRIVESHGGRLWFEPTAGTGTTFLFRLPTELPPKPVLPVDSRSPRTKAYS